ncbi:MAG: type II toxin-antitoxin system PemK/MazF family toxin [bacterium]
MDFDFDKMYCGVIRRGDVLKCEFNNGGGRKKERVVVVIQDDVLNESMPSIVCAIVEPYQPEDDIFVNEVLLKNTETGLGSDGICMLHKLITVDRRLIISKKGELKSKRLKEIYQALDINLGRFRD